MSKYLRHTAGILFLFLTQMLYAQVKTDTVQRGYYIPFDSNYVSCRVVITPKGKNADFTNTTGNKLPDSLMNRISYLEPGSVVVYDEVTVMNNSVLQKATAKRYVVGSKNTAVVKRDPFYPDTLTAIELGQLKLDRHVYSFLVKWTLHGDSYSYEVVGNQIYGSCRAAVRALPSGTKVYIERIRWQNDDYSKKVLPTEIHIVK